MKKIILLTLALAFNGMAAISNNAWNFGSPGKKVVQIRTHQNAFLWKVEGEPSWLGIPTTHANFDVIVSQIMDAKRTAKGIEAYVGDMLPADASVYNVLSVGTF